MTRIIDQYTKLPITNHKKWALRHPEAYKKSNKERTARRDKKIKSLIFGLLGGKCSNPECPYPDIGLEIHHVNEDGDAERETYGNCNYTYYKHILNKLRQGSKDYRLLCEGCHKNIHHQ